MKKRFQNLNKTSLIVFSLIIYFLVQISIPIHSNGQSIYSDMPKSYQKDDTKLCAVGAERYNEDFCIDYRGYLSNETVNPPKAAEFRDKMLYDLKREIDDYYNGYKIGREKKTKWFQTVLDILGIGLAFAGTVSNGARVKTVLGATAGSFLAGRNSVNDRFQLLQQKILINTMESNRLKKWAEIVELMQKDIKEFRWEDARGKLQEYAFRGTFEDALNSLVDESGAQVQNAQINLKNVRKAVSQTTLKAKLDNFNGFIRPMNVTAIKLDADITAINAAIPGLAAGSPALLKAQGDLADLQTKKNNLMENYKNIWLAIQVNGDFDAIDQKIQTNYGAFPAVIGRYTAFKANFDATPPGPITADDYDFVLTKVNAVVGEDEDLNNRFLEILKTHKL